MLKLAHSQCSVEIIYRTLKYNKDFLNDFSDLFIDYAKA